MKPLALLALLLLPLQAAASPSWFDRSHAIFFPPALQETISASQTFPIFWWNFAVLEVKDWSQARALCKKLKSFPPELVFRAECEEGLGDLKTFASEWADDLPLREGRPPDSTIYDNLESTLAQASLPMGDQNLIPLLQSDPLQSWQDLRKRVEERLNIHLSRTNGMYFDPQTQRAIIPVQAAFDPTQTAKTRAILSQLDDSVFLLGPHGSTLRNEDQVTRDLGAVSKAGYCVLAVFGALLLVLRRWRLLLLFPAVFAAVALGGLLTVLVFGSIHGLTLSLGAGIIGLALDYGFNAAMADPANSKLTWRSNTIGVLTTLIGLLVLMQSKIPLLRQMTFFSAVGLMAGFGIFHFLLNRFPKTFHSQPAGISFSPNRFKTALILFLLVASGAGFFLLHPDLDMSKFDFQDAKTQPISQWVYKTLDVRPPLFTVNHGNESLASAHREHDWAQTQKIPLENLANYIPPAAAQSANLASWNQTGCANLVAKLDPTARQFFAHFLDRVACHAPEARLAGAQLVRAYTRHLNSGESWITLWMPPSDAQESALRKAFPGARSLREAVLAFPHTLNAELSWMAPASVILVFLILLVYYRRLKPSVVALVPFFSGLGLFTLIALAFKLEVSFISVIALVMCFGFSFDYAVFAVDHCLRDPQSSGVWEAITSAACATMAGFIPLLFCTHPVLKHLGQALCISTVGCYIGAVWGVPGLIGQKTGARR